MRDNNTYLRAFRHTFIALMLAVFTVNAYAGEFEVFKGASVPEMPSQVDLEWIYNGEIVEDLQFRILELNDDGTTVSSDIVSSTKLHLRYELTSLEVGIERMFLIEAFDRDSVYANSLALIPIATKGGFTSIVAEDVPHDAGEQIAIKWTLSGDAARAEYVKVYRSEGESKAWELIGQAKASDGKFVDNHSKDETPYNYMIRATTDRRIFESEPVYNITSMPSWFDFPKINLLIIMLIVLSLMGYYILRRQDKPMFIRRIAGLQAITEAVGRSTEMGRNVLFVPGIQDLDDVQTIAGLTILGHVAKLTAKYETTLDVPVSRSLVMSNGREVVKEAYLSVGRPDFYHDDIVHYITDEQFGYVAAIDGIMVREKPAACFYMGAFFAESLILAETGNHVGAIQIAGTAMPTQLPFFVAACDYTLIGEELFAASAYLSGDNRMIASLRGQDIGKAIAMVSIILGSVLVTIGTFAGEGSFPAKMADGFVRLFSQSF